MSESSGFAPSLLSLDRVTKVYRMGDVEVHALRGVSLDEFADTIGNDVGSIHESTPDVPAVFFETRFKVCEHCERRVKAG